MSRVAVLLACYNRKEKTLAGLESMFRQEDLPDATQITVYLLDDGSTDGTSQAVAGRYPQVRLLPGSGKLFWNGGMRVAFGAALKEDFDAYLWLNDDTHIFPTALAELLRTSSQLGDKAIVAASIRDPESGRLTYGGVSRLQRRRRLSFTAIAPQAAPLAVETMNGNCVLIPREVARRVGNLDQAFTHGFGDLDYGLRARRLGCEVYIAAGYHGVCLRNPLREAWKNPTLPLGARWKSVTSHQGLPPGEWAVFARRHAGVFWPVYWLMPYIHAVVPGFGSFAKAAAVGKAGK